jgi:hypothetical protein
MLEYKPKYYYWELVKIISNNFKYQLNIFFLLIIYIIKIYSI